MTKPEALDLLMLLSAMESWAMAQGKHMPDYLHEQIATSNDVLRSVVLGKRMPAMTDERCGRVAVSLAVGVPGMAE